MGTRDAPEIRQRQETKNTGAANARRQNATATGESRAACSIPPSAPPASMAKMGANAMPTAPAANARTPLLVVLLWLSSLAGRKEAPAAISGYSPILAVTPCY